MIDLDNRFVACFCHLHQYRPVIYPGKGETIDVNGAVTDGILVVRSHRALMVFWRGTWQGHQLPRWQKRRGFPFPRWLSLLLARSEESVIIPLLARIQDLDSIYVAVE